ncbi:phosphoribosylformylglycinamidine cyclo-ligase [Zhaonella formicivorans]|jgi:phosphoribosylformylglycinamidine cyclo-ligase|uniref:phosphoribosylformylglycinamidine cyclo-ligase n=1 Tax=Zhaonella formicivorans TaxID=2528593 RepID=UPI0010E10AA8|nr:phosphoribosylformylglycinamidine cyclo-ligase [Zhaonella formicivorans]
MEKKSLTYQDAGVDIAAGNKAVELMKSHVKKTWRPEVLGDLGSFGGFFALNKGKYQEPVLVAGTDGVGTKLRVAMLMDKHDTIGIDAVAMCVNDILVQGAEPLFFLDYLAVGKLVPEKVADIVGGIASGCREAGCALIGGETAEMPGFYAEEEYDVAGFAVGIVEKSKIIDGRDIICGDKIIGIASSGLHSNGYSLARKVLLEAGGLKLDQVVRGVGRPLGDELLTPTKIYVRPVLKLLEMYQIKGMAHITGGGLTENVPRILPRGVNARISLGSWPIPPIFTLIQELGNVSTEEMYRTFNMGIGIVLVVPEEQEQAVIHFLEQQGEQAFPVGEIVAGSGVMEYRC